jgi:hypothetical protein
LWYVQESNQFDGLKADEVAMEKMTPWMWFLAFMGWATTILLIKTIVLLWGGAYLPAVLYFGISVVLFTVFFRRRMLILIIIGLTFLLATTSLTAVFHHSTPGVVIAAGSFVCLILLGRWQTRKYPYLTSANWQTLFDKDPW